MDDNRVEFEDGVWTIESWENDIGKRLMVYCDNPHIIDYPIYYGGYSVGYDRPELIPEHIKEKVLNIYKKIREE